MITPARWFNTGTGLDVFREKMLHDDRIAVMSDFINARNCFSNVEIKGGVQYFLWNSNYHGKCNITTYYENGNIAKSFRPLIEPGMDSYIRNTSMISILKKVKSKDELSFSILISSRDPFGYDIRLPGSYKVAKHKYSLKKTNTFDVEFYYNGWRNDGVGYVSLDSVNDNKEWVDKIKVLIPKAWGTGDESTDRLNPFIVGKHSVCTETYLVIGPFADNETAKNVVSYINTKFFHMMVSFLKISQNAAKGVFNLVPIQDFSKVWTDKMLYEKYSFTQDEIMYIESIIRSKDGEAGL